ncbi:MAG: DUF551 domain-containing protein [Anaeromassilibacillus sp.]|jgi:hypothetical protein
MTDQELIQALREHAEWARANEWECPITLGDDIYTAIQRLEQMPRWIPVTERLPEERVLVNVVWVNRAPEPYYEKIKDVPFSGTACFYGGRWYWDSPVLLDYLAEYGKDEFDLVDVAVEITHWMPLPAAPGEEPR